MGMGEAMQVIEELAKRGVFRERDLKPWRLSHNWLPFAAHLGLVKQHGHGVWSHARYQPTTYEQLQLRFPGAVFWGPSALWLLGVLPREPEAHWIAIANNARLPTRVDDSTVVVRTRRLEADVIAWLPDGRFITLRVHSRERAEADTARTDCSRLLARALVPGRFELARDASLLSAAMPLSPSHSEPVMPTYRGPPDRDLWFVSSRLVLTVHPRPGS